MNKKTVAFHIGANRYPPLTTTHHTRRIWEELSIAFDEYHVIGRSLTRSASKTVVGNLTLHLLPSLTRISLEFFFTSWLLIYLSIKYRPTHLLAQCPVMGGLAAAACSKFLGAPLFVELHGNHYFAPVRSGIIGKIEYYAYRLFSKVSFAAATQIRTLSDEMSASLRAHYGEKVSRKIVMIPTRVDLEIFSNIKKDYRIGSKLKLITVGSLSPRKNHINLMRDLAAGNLPFELTIVGDGLLRNQYLQVIDELNISSQVILTGNMAHSDLADLLITQDIYIHYSLSEGLPRAILEAMAVALPVITSPVGFTKNIFLNGENSVILENPLAASLRRELGEISLSIEMRCKLGISARKLIEDKFNANDIFRLYRAAVLQMTSMSN